MWRDSSGKRVGGVLKEAPTHFCIGAIIRQLVSWCPEVRILSFLVCFHLIRCCYPLSKWMKLGASLVVAVWQLAGLDVSKCSGIPFSAMFAIPRKV